MLALLFLMLLCTFPVSGELDTALKTQSSAQKCSYQVTGCLDDCTCDVETIRDFNNKKLFPKLQELLQSDYFRYYKVNLKKPCPFWSDNSHCGLKDCAVKPCEPNEVPAGIRSESLKYTEEANVISQHDRECENAEKLGAVNNSLSEETKQAMLDWTRHDDSTDNFCDVDDEDSPDAEYVDLLLNPERYTGYKGREAWKIWNSIYEENCFKPNSIRRPFNPLLPGRGDEGNSNYSALDDPDVGLAATSDTNSTSSNSETVHSLWKARRNFTQSTTSDCVSRRDHSIEQFQVCIPASTSILVHDIYYEIKFIMPILITNITSDTWYERKWGHNITEFKQRFDAQVTQGEGTRRLRNLYFLYLIELRALSKVLPFFERSAFQLYTGNNAQDTKSKKLLLEILNLAKSFPSHFDEHSLFAGEKKEAENLKEEFRLHFKNISRIMDCVGCFKCRLWGKLQTQGLGTALKILFSEKQINSLQDSGPSQRFHLTRQDIVALLNAFGRISTSVWELQTFTQLLETVQ